MQPDTPKRQPHDGLLSLDQLRRMCYNQKKEVPPLILLYILLQPILLLFDLVKLQK